MKKKILLVALVAALTIAAPAAGAKMPVVNAASISTTAKANATKGALVVIEDNLNVRAGASLTADKLTEVHKGEIYRYVDVQDGWYCIVTADQVLGWVRGIYVEASPSANKPVSMITSDYTIKEGVLVKYKGSESKILIPDVVTAIGNYAFKDCTTLVDAKIPKTVTTIGNGAFYGCNNLKEMDIPDSVTSIGDYAFNGCTAMRKVTIPNSVKSIGGYAFYNCEGLTSLNIPNSVKTIGEFAFMGCYGIEKVDLPNSVTSLGKGAFSNCESLMSVVLPSSLPAINDLTFAHCYKLKNITIPKSVTSIGRYAFANCLKLTNVYYTGSETEWKNIKINNADNANDFLNKATIRYNCVVKVPLKITEQPVNQVVLMGGKVVFTIKAQGDDVKYQWQLSDDGGKTWRNSKITSTTYESKLTPTNVNRLVRCVVTDKVGYWENSNVVSMRQSALRIVTQPTDRILKLYGTAHFTIDARGEYGEVLSYQWQVSDDAGKKKTWRNVGTNADIYTVSVNKGNNGRYVRCVVTDKYGNQLPSNTVQMGLIALKIKSPITDVVAKRGEVVSFKLDAEGVNLVYQWQLSDDNGETWRDSSTTIATYSTILSDKNNGRYVRCLVTDDFGNYLYSSSARMIVAPSNLKITDQPVNMFAKVGGKVSCRVGCEGDGLTYQWQLSDDHGKTWRNSSTKEAVYSTTMSDKNNGRFVRCIVTDKYGDQVISEAANMKIK
ncbi:MAG: leucine-rich repeat protein [Clostridia bacterium]|nr:leucine-rich repeat protein [Clostridia bacterium]MBQ1553918.1 leucine-rich repeat protein [Clostridia bacterium]